MHRCRTCSRRKRLEGTAPCIASKRLHLSNPMCSVSGTWGIKIHDEKSASKMPYIKLWVCLHAGKYAYPQLCGIFEADVTVSIPTPCSADAPHGVTEMRPLRGHRWRWSAIRWELGHYTYEVSCTIRWRWSAIRWELGHYTYEVSCTIRWRGVPYNGS